MYLCVCIYINFLLINSHPGVSRPSLLWVWSQCPASVSGLCCSPGQAMMEHPQHWSAGLHCADTSKGSLSCKAINLSSEDFIEK